MSRRFYNVFSLEYLRGNCLFTYIYFIGHSQLKLTADRDCLKRRSIFGDSIGTIDRSRKHIRIVFIA